MTDSDLVLRRMTAELAYLRRELARCKAREAVARREAELDPLTGLPNRRAFDVYLRQQVARHLSSGSAMAVLFIDIDGFKAVNDGHGHAVGDTLLRVVGARLRHAMRAGDGVCRLGGDEFACVLVDVGTEQRVEQVACKLRASVCQPCMLGALTLTVQPSIGAAMFPRDGSSAPELLQHADGAMYRAKRGRPGFSRPDLVPAAEPGWLDAPHFDAPNRFGQTGASAGLLR